MLSLLFVGKFFSVLKWPTAIFRSNEKISQSCGNYACDDPGTSIATVNFHESMSSRRWV